jgi:general secretion pathway protein A
MSRPPLGLRQHPFGATPDPDAFFPSPGHESARAEIFAAVKTLAGLIVLTGEPGTGKTTLLRRVAGDVEAAGGRVLWCSLAAVLDEPLGGLARQLNAPDATSPGVGREELVGILRARARPDGATVVAVDEAQHLGQPELEELRAFADAAMASGTRVAVLLVGQPELDLRLAGLRGDGGSPVYALRVELPRLPAAEVRPYVSYRLGLAGARLNDVFQPDAIERIARYARGIPRIINQLCETALLTADQAGVAMVSAAIVDAAARRLALPLPGRAARHARGARAGAPTAQAKRAKRGRATPRARLAGAGVAVAVLVLATAVFFATRRTPPPPPPSEMVALAPAEAPPPSPIAPDPGRPKPEQAVRVAPPPPQATKTADPPAQPRSKSRPAPSREPAARPSARGGTPLPLAPPAPAPSVTTKASPGAVALLDNAEVGNLAEVQALLAAGVSPEARDGAGMTPLMLAVVHDHGAVAEQLLAGGADVNASDDGGVTALMLAASNGRAALLQRLVARGANVDARTRAGWTALIYAAWNGHQSVVRRLLAAGADPALTDRNGWTALQYAIWRAADSSRTRPPDATDPLLADAESPEAAYRRYSELVDLLSGATRKR